MFVISRRPAFVRYTMKIDTWGDYKYFLLGLYISGCRHLVTGYGDPNKYITTKISKDGSILKWIEEQNG